MIHSVSNLLEEPVKWVLMIFLVISAVFIGSLIGEAIVKTVKNRYDVKLIIEKIYEGARGNMKNIIAQSSLNKMQKDSLIQIADSEHLSEKLRTEKACSVISDMETRYERIVNYTDIIIKLAPVAGLMGTLIPLGPGIMALGGGDIQTLSESILSAFDTTVAGLVSASAATVVSGIRKLWYKKYIADTESLAECILEMLKDKE
jgi:biopolymer transport protein ExbB/TolQ